MKKNKLYCSGFQPDWDWIPYVSLIDKDAPPSKGAHSPRWVGASTPSQKAQTKIQSAGKKITKTGAGLNNLGLLGKRPIGI